MSTKSSAEATDYILRLPPALQPAVKADSLPPLKSADAVTLLVQQTVARSQQSYVDSVIPPPLTTSPIECRIYEQVRVIN